MAKTNNTTKRILLIVIAIIILGVCVVTAINFHVISSTSKYIYSTPDASPDLDNVDAILVLGCLVNGYTPSDMLRDRLDVGIDLYNLNAAPKLLMSGDNSRVEYNEVWAMRKYAIEKNVSEKDVFMDHAGFSTYESMYRAKEIFGVDRMVVVTQGYHLYRSVYIARSLGIDAYGVPSDLHTYSGQMARDVREVVARCKDFLYCIFKPEPTYLGEKIDISQDYSATND